MWRMLFLKETQQTLGCQGRRWYRSYQCSARQMFLFKQRMTWTTSFRQSVWHIWKGLGVWLHLRQGLQNNHIFLFYNINIGTWWLKRSGRIYGVKTHLVIFLFVMLISFSWIWMKTASLVIKVTERLFAATINPTINKLQWFEVFNYIPPGWEFSSCEWSSYISSKGYRGAP